MKNLERSLAFVILLGNLGLLVLSLGCSSTPRVENVRAVRGQEPYQFGQAPEQRVIENGGKQYDRHVRSLQDARLRHEEAMVRMEYEKREREYARTNGLATPQSSVQPQSGPPVFFQQQAWPVTGAPVAFVPPSPDFIIGPDDLVDGSRQVYEVRNLNGGGAWICPPAVRVGAAGHLVRGRGPTMPPGGYVVRGGGTTSGGYFAGGGGGSTTSGGHTVGGGGGTISGRYSTGGGSTTSGGYSNSGGYTVGGR